MDSSEYNAIVAKAYRLLEHADASIQRSKSLIETIGSKERAKQEKQDKVARAIIQEAKETHGG